MEWNELLRVARAAARGAVQVHQQYVGQVPPDQWTNKGSADFVSFVDRAAEAGIVQVIRDAFPSHEILAEEDFADRNHRTGAHWAEHDWVWLVDPLDGTTNFLHGYPAYSASVAIAQRGRLVAGTVINSTTGEEWCAAAGQGAMLNDQPIRVSTIDHLPSALIGTGFPFKNLALLDGYLQQFSVVLRNSSGIRRAGSAAIDLCHVACGRFDGFWELDLFPWDMAAGVLMIREAGGIVSAFSAEYAPFERSGLLAGNPVIYDALRNLLEGAS